MNKANDDLTPAASVDPDELLETPTVPTEDSKVEKAPRSRRPRRQANTALARPWRMRSPTAEIAELPPDYREEVASARKASAHRREQTHRPMLPMVMMKVTLHCPEIQRIYVEVFTSCNEYAVAMDAVARTRLQDREAYDRYMSQFDEHLAALANYADVTIKRFEKQANGGMAESPSPMIFEAKLQSPRTRKLLDSIQLLDDAARHASFLTIYGSMDPDAYANTIRKIRNRITRTARGLQAVKTVCFRDIRNQNSPQAQKGPRIPVAASEAGRSVRRGPQPTSGRAAGLTLDDGDDDGEGE